MSKSIREQIFEESEYHTHDCGCCGFETIELSTLYTILKEKGVDLDN